MRLFSTALSIALLSFGCDVEDLDDPEFRASACADMGETYSTSDDFDQDGFEDEYSQCIVVCTTDIGDTYQRGDDYDNDGLEDDFDNCPYSCNTAQIDQDGDGIGDACDNAPNVSNPLD